MALREPGISPQLPQPLLPAAEVVGDLVQHGADYTRRRMRTLPGEITENLPSISVAR